MILPALINIARLRAFPGRCARLSSSTALAVARSAFKDHLRQNQEFSASTLFKQLARWSEAHITFAK